jgi:hypothetical protein
MLRGERREIAVGKYAWCVRIGDGTVRYFDEKAEAEALHRAAIDRKLEATTSAIPLPLSVAEFVHFLERKEAERRVAETTLAEIEKLTPNWRGFQSLPEAVEHAIRDGKN